jgi:hypothetical protein
VYRGASRLCISDDESSHGWWHQLCGRVFVTLQRIRASVRPATGSRSMTSCGVLINCARSILYFCMHKVIPLGIYALVDFALNLQAPVQCQPLAPTPLHFCPAAIIRCRLQNDKNWRCSNHVDGGCRPSCALHRPSSTQHVVTTPHN